MLLSLRQAPEGLEELVAPKPVEPPVKLLDIGSSRSAKSSVIHAKQMSLLVALRCFKRHEMVRSHASTAHISTAFKV